MMSSTRADPPNWAARLQVAALSIHISGVSIWNGLPRPSEMALAKACKVSLRQSGYPE